MIEINDSKDGLWIFAVSAATALSVVAAVLGVLTV